MAVAAALIIFAALAWWWLVPRFAGSGDQAMLPYLYTVLIGVLAVAMLASTLHRTSQPADDDPFVETGGGEPGHILVLAVVWGAFALAIDTTGFYLGGFVALIVSFMLLGARRPLPLLGWSAGTLAVVWLVFQQSFGLVIRPSSLERLLLGG